MPTTEQIAIVQKPIDSETSDQPFGQRFAAQTFVLRPEHLAALEAGQTIALDIQSEYVAYLRLEAET